MDEEIDYQLDDFGKKLDHNKKSSKVAKSNNAIISILLFIIVLLIAASIIIFIYINNKLNEEEDKNQQEKKKKEEDYLLAINGFKEEWYDIYGEKLTNLSYAENGIIPNTYRKGKANYIEELGDINSGKDYTKYEETNVYDLYIPYSSYKRKEKHNGVMLFVHGGGFENNTKEEVECFAVRFVKLGFITTNIEYTNCLDKYKEKSFLGFLTK